MTERTGRIPTALAIAALLALFLYGAPARAQDGDRETCLKSEGWNPFSSPDWNARIQACTAYLKAMNHIRGDSFLALRNRAIARSHVGDGHLATGDMIRVVNQNDRRVVRAVQDYLDAQGYLKKYKGVQGGVFGLGTQAALSQCAKTPDCVEGFFGLWKAGD